MILTKGVFDLFAGDTQDKSTPPNEWGVQINGSGWENLCIYTVS